MTRGIVITPKASKDIDDIFRYISQSNPETALRFFDSTRQSRAKLAKTPGKGSLYVTDNSSLEGLRKWAIDGFKKYLIFYLYDDDLLTVIRIIYAARDIPNILENK